MRILILGMRSWGELGNFLAARQLGRVIAAELPTAEVEVIAAEEGFRPFEAFGGQIKDLSVTSQSSSERSARYGALTAEMEQLFPPDFEIRPDARLLPALTELALLLHAKAPDLVIGTKGIIARTCTAALKLFGYSLPTLVGNFVTNQGLLGLRLHHAYHAHLHMVQTNPARALLLEKVGVPEQRVRVVGFFAVVRTQELLGARSKFCPPDEKPLALVFANRGGPEYYRILEVITSASVEAIFICLSDPNLLCYVQMLKKERGCAGLSIYDTLTQDQYLSHIARLSRSRRAFLICKSGPNTVLEALAAGIPILALRSGLPTEEWVADMIEHENVGRAFENADDLIPVLNKWLSLDGPVLAHKAAAEVFAAQKIDSKRTARLIGNAVRDYLGAVAA